MSSHGRIFISYRRDTGSSLARLVEQELRRRGFPVFLDVEDLQSGHFNSALKDEIATATDVVVILTPGCLDRCQNDGDWVRQEIVHAIECEINIIPFMSSDFSFPSEALPEDMQEFSSFHGIEFSHNEFASSMNRLVSLLKGKRTRRKLPAILTLGVVALLAGSFLLARLLPNDDVSTDPTADKPAPDGGVANTPRTPPIDPGAKPDTEPDKASPSPSPPVSVSGADPKPEPKPEPAPAPEPQIDYTGLAADLVKALRSDIKSDLPAGLQIAIDRAGEAPTEEIPRVVNARVELICLKMALQGSWESEVDIQILHRMTEPPFDSKTAPLALANEKLELADLLIAEDRISDANLRLKEGFELLDEGISRKSEVCRLKKGSLLTRHLHFKYKGKPGLELPGDATQGLSLMEGAYKAFRARHLDRSYFEPADYALTSGDSDFEASAALVIAQCWHHGIGTGKPGANDAAAGFESKQAAKKAIDYYRKVLELNKDNGEARAGLLEMLIFQEENHWNKEMIELAKRGAELNDDYCMYQYALHLWSENESENEEETRSLMRELTRPSRQLKEQAGKWIEEHPRK